MVVVVVVVLRGDYYSDLRQADSVHIVAFQTDESGGYDQGSPTGSKPVATGIPPLARLEDYYLDRLDNDGLVMFGHGRNEKLRGDAIHLAWRATPARLLDTHPWVRDELNFA
jgi:hypothetical protein